MRSLLCLVALLITLSGNAFAQMFVDYATVSPTAPLQSNRLCYSDGRDIACDNAAGLLITSGTFQIPTLYATTVSATGTTGTVSATYGYFKYVSASNLSGAGASTFASLTDVSASSPASGQLVRYNGSKWEAVNASTALSTTTMVQSWPDALLCNYSSPAFGYTVVPLAFGPYSNGTYQYQFSSAGNYVLITFDSAGNFSSHAASIGTGTSDCDNKSIATLYSTGKAFNFIGSNLSSAASPNNSLQWSNAGNQAGDANLQWLSSTAVVSVTGTVSTTNVSATSLQLNGASVTCAAGTVGIVRRSPTTGRLQVCQ